MLCVSSEVAYGPVGNSAVVPAIQGNGIAAYSVPSVVLSNHPGHGGPAGLAVPDDTLKQMLETMTARGWLDNCSGIITGYFSTAGQVEAVAQTISTMKARNATLTYLCDPVLGDDHTGLYVPEEVAQAIRDHLVPLANVISPNRFELEWLSGAPVGDAATAGVAVGKLTCPVVLATSLPAANGFLDTAVFEGGSVHCVTTALRERVPHGTGDLLAGLFLAAIITGKDSSQALRLAMNRLEAVLDASLAGRSRSCQRPLYGKQHMTAVSRQSIADAYQRIKPHVRKTPVIDVQLDGLDTPVTLKLEMLQHSGSFKARGAFANLIGAKVPDSGVAAASGGNHGAAIAYAAQTLGIAAHIFVPASSPQAKIDKIKGYGADVVVKGERYANSLDLCDAFVSEHGALSIHAYDAIATLNGQGTLALELEEQTGDIDTLLVAVGGGGLIGGIAAWCERAPKVIAVEPQDCATLHTSLSKGERTAIKPGGVAMDALGASTPGELMFPIAQRAVADAFLVSDDDIRSAQRWLWNNLRLVSEPGGATAFAALLSGHYKPESGERVCAIVCGANTDLEVFSKTINQSA